jgi:nucleoid-associated protein YgaU
MTQTVTVSGGSLYALAAQYFGDGTQWVRIAQQNGLSDPVLYGITTLVIPDPLPSYSADGVPPQ